MLGRWGWGWGCRKHVETINVLGCVVNKNRKVISRQSTEGVVLEVCVLQPDRRGGKLGGWWCWWGEQRQRCMDELTARGVCVCVCWGGERGRRGVEIILELAGG